MLTLGRPDVSASGYIAEIQRRLRAQERVRLAVVAELHAVPFDQCAPRVYTVLKLDERRDRPDQTLEDKVRSVENRLREDL